MIPEDIKDILKNADQEISLSFDIGATLSEIILNEKAAIEVLEKGARASLKLTLVSNIRKSVMEILKNHEDMPSGVSQMLMSMIPLAMCQLNG